MTQVTVDNETFIADINNETIAVGDSAERLLDYSSGSWNSNSIDDIYALDDGGMVVYDRDADNLYRINPDGTVNWQNSGTNPVYFDVDEQNSIVFWCYNSTNGHFETLDLDTGNRIDIKSTTTPSGVISVALADDNSKFYVSEGSQTVYEYDTTLTQTNTYDITGANRVRLGMANSSNYVPFASDSGQMGYIDVNNTSSNELFSAPSNSMTEPSLSDNGIFFIGDQSNNNITAYDTSTQTKKWEFTTSQSPNEATAVFNGTFFAEWDNDTIYQISEAGVFEETYKLSNGVGSFHADSTSTEDSLAVNTSNEAAILSLENSNRKVFQVEIQKNQNSSVLINNNKIMSSDTNMGGQSFTTLLTSGDIVESNNTIRISGYRVR